ncbi:hypothetical protein L798_00274 [Zootermopsis nevadensis]|uniref:Uncharacterized protein n=1 Tax=Zootermopsis nevadensis TaxID=136037 RepID=A0A067QNV9_ZOONE|nr:hypothetical protein L798_00274 [Zootermopsis nevadensis]
MLKDAAAGPFMASNLREIEGKHESDEDHKKKRPPVSLDIFEEVPFTKKARLDLPLVRLLLNIKHYI